MLEKALSSLNSAQKAELRKLGISDQLRSDWKHGRQRPNQAQAAILEVMAGLAPHSLRDYLMIEKAKPAEKEWLKKAVGKLKLGAGVTLSYGAGAVAVFVAASERVATMYRERNGVGGPAHNSGYVNLKSPKPQARGEARAQTQCRKRPPSERAK